MSCNCYEHAQDLILHGHLSAAPHGLPRGSHETHASNCMMHDMFRV